MPDAPKQIAVLYGPLVLAADYRVPDFDRWWTWLRSDLPRLPELGAQHVVVYRAIRDPNHVFVTIGVREREPVDALLRSPQLITWFDAAGVTELPPLFAGQVVEKIDLPHPPPLVFSYSLQQHYLKKNNFIKTKIPFP